MDLGYKSININDIVYNFIDSPGHKDYIVKMINGSSQADHGLFVIDCVDFGGGKLGNNIELISVIKGLGIQNLIVALNKADLVSWNQDSINKIIKNLKEVLKPYNFQSLEFVPISAFQSKNITDKFNWERSLMDVLGSLKPQP